MYYVWLKKNIHILYKYYSKIVLVLNIFISVLLFYVDTTSFEDVSPQCISDDSSTGSRVHGKQWT